MQSNQSARCSNILVWTIILLLGVQVVLSFFQIIKVDAYIKLTLQGSSRQLNSNLAYVGNVPRYVEDPQQGDADPAEITVTVFSDYECPYCADAAGVIDELLTRYPGRIAIVYKDFPLESHPNSYRAAEAAMCAHFESKYIEMHDLIFESQDSLTEDIYSSFAEILGLDISRFESCMENGEARSIIDQNISLAKSLDIPGTPTFIVNGYILGMTDLQKVLTVMLREEVSTE